MTKKKEKSKKEVETKPTAEAVTPEATAEAVEKLEELKSDAAGEDSVNEFMEPKKKRKYTKRKKVTETEDSEKPKIDIEQTKGYVRPVFEMVSAAGVKIAESPDAAMGASELEICMNAAAQCVNQYLPNVLGEHAALVVLSLTMTNYSLRVYMLRQKKLRELIAERAAMGNVARPMEGNA